MAISETTGRPTVSVHLLPNMIPAGALRGGVAVVVDVLRATTAMVRALESGCDAILACGEIEEARARATALPAGTALLAGERQGLPIPGFDLGNSPDDFTPDVCRGKTLVMTTTNGTRALLASREAARVGVAALTNVSAASQWAARDGRDVHVVCAGTDGHVSLEDTLLAGEIAGRLWRFHGYTLGNDSARIALGFFSDVFRVHRDEGVPWVDLVALGRGGRRVREIGLAGDLEAAAGRETSEVVPFLEDGSTRLVREQGRLP